MQIMQDKILRERFIQLLKASLNYNISRIIVVVGKDQYLIENFDKDGRDLILSASVKLG